MFTPAKPLFSTSRLTSPSTPMKRSVDPSDKEFRQYYVERTLSVTRAALSIGVVLVVAVCVLDLFLMPPAFWKQAIPFRAVMMLLPMSFALAATFHIQERQRIPYITATVALIVGVATILTGGMATRHGVPFVLWGMIFTTFNVYLVLGLNLRQSVAVGWPIFIVYIGISLVVGSPIHNLAYGALFLCFSNVVGTYASLLLERNARDIFESRRALSKLAQTDGLTGLYNRREFDKHLKQVWKQARRDKASIAIVLVDIDHFKLFNDCYQHQAGDQCIIDVAAVLTASINRPLDLVARYGGEEFAIVMYDPTRSFVESFARGLCRKVVDLAVEHKASTISPVVTVSAGAALAHSSDTIFSDQLLRRADDALYEAKQLGRNQAVTYQSSWNEQTLSQAALSVV